MARGAMREAASVYVSPLRDRKVMAASFAVKAPRAKARTWLGCSCSLAGFLKETSRMRRVQMLSTQRVSLIAVSESRG